MKIKNNTDIKTITKPSDIYEIIRAIYKQNDKTDRDKEQLYLIGLDTRNNIKCINLVSMGTINESLISPREIFKTALLENCTFIILVHNHPSQNPTPSNEDIEVTKKIYKASEIMQIILLDHLIYTDNEYFSMKASNINFKGK